MTLKFILYVPSVSKILLFFLLSFSCNAQLLEIKESQNGVAYISYDNAPAFGFGASPQNILTYLPEGNGNDYRDWLKWAGKHNMNHVRSYPPSFIVEAPAENIYQYADKGRNIFDLSKFNANYFDELRRACKLMKDQGFFVHFQFWQAVAWKKQWDRNYFNPLNNVNPDISLHAEPGAFMVLKNPVLLEHQKKYVQKILDATADLGNVYFDIANEIGNGTGRSKDWVLEILNTIREWETKNNLRLLVTINDEGGMRVNGFEEIVSKTDLIIKDLGRWDEHVDTQRVFQKPTISVRNIDWDYQEKKRLWFYGDLNLEINEDRKLQTRGRKYWWRMFMARVQMAGAYADAYNFDQDTLFYRLVNKLSKKAGLGNILEGKFEASYRLNTLAEDNFHYFRRFIDRVEDYANMLASDQLVIGHPAAHNYGLQSKKELVIYLESPNGKAGFSYPETLTNLTGLTLEDGHYSGFFYYPGTGNKSPFRLLIKDGKAQLLVPEFEDDLAIYVQK